MVFPTEGILEVTTESWPEWDLNPQPLIPLLTDLPIRFLDIAIESWLIYTS